jgi:hypothetical protein
MLADLLDFVRSERGEPIEDWRVIAELQMLAKTNPEVWPTGTAAQWQRVIDEAVDAGSIVRVANGKLVIAPEPPKAASGQMGLFD